MDIYLPFYPRTNNYTTPQHWRKKAKTKVKRREIWTSSRVVKLSGIKEYLFFMLLLLFIFGPVPLTVTEVDGCRDMLRFVLIISDFPLELIWLLVVLRFNSGLVLLIGCWRLWMAKTLPISSSFTCIKTSNKANTEIM